MEKNMEYNPFGTVEQALADLASGKMIIVTDDENRENEGDIIVSCKFATPQTLNFIAKNACGLICMPVSKKLAQKLDFEPMTYKNTDNHGTAFTISIDHISNSTGISAFDRSATAMAVASETCTSDDFRRPGHMFPLISKEYGVLERAGHTEATVDLCRLAGLPEAGLCCEIMSEDGSMARLDELSDLAKKWGMTIISINQLIAYRKSHEKIIDRVAKSNLPTKYGMFELYGFKDLVSGEHHEALVMGNVKTDDPVLCRVHSECLTGDTFGSLKCDCGQQLDLALKKISEEGRGILVYLTQEGRGIGILNKIKAYALQDTGMDTVDANLALGLPEDARDYNVGIQILKDLGVSKIKLMTNNPKKIYGLGDKNCGLEITERIPLQIKSQKFDSFYLETKMKRMGHLLNNI